MGKGGGGTTTTTNTNQPPQAVLDAYTKLIGQAQNTAATPYQAYTGQTVAPLTDMQNQGLASINAAQGIANPYLAKASNYADASTGNVLNGVQAYNQANIAQYADPYQQQVVDATQANINQSNAVQQQQLLGSAIQSGASPFGGDRAGVAAAELARTQDLAGQQTIAGLESQGFQNAQQQFNTQNQQTIAGNTANSQLNAQAANTYGNLGLAAQSSALQGAQAQLAGGTLQQQTNQANLASQYSQWQQQQAYPFQTTQWLGNLVEGIGSNSGGTSTSSSPAPNSIFNKGGRVHYDVGGGVPYGGVSYIDSQPLSLGHTMPSTPQKEQSQSGLSQATGLLGAANGVKSLFGGSGGGLGNLMDSFEGTQLGNSLTNGGLFSASEAGLPWLEGAGGAAGAAGEAGAAAGGSELLGDLGMAAMFAKVGGRINRAGGGLIPHFDDGGDVDDLSDQETANMDDEGNTFRSASEPLSSLGSMQTASALPVQTGSQDITAHNNPGLAVANANPQVETPTPSLGLSLLAAGLGAASGSSPYVMQNIAKGGLLGLSNYGEQQQQILAQQKEKQLEKHQDTMDSKPIIDNSGPTVRVFHPSTNEWVDTGLPTNKGNEAKANQPLQQAKTDYYKKKAESDNGSFSMTPGMGQDENGANVQGAYVQNKKDGTIQFKPGVVLTGKGGKGQALLPPNMSEPQAKEQAKTDAKRMQSYNNNRPYIDNSMAALDKIDANLDNGFETGAQGASRLAVNKGIAMAADTPFLGAFVPKDTAKKATDTATAGANIDKSTNDLVTELNKFQYAPGGRGSVLGLKTMLASKPGIDQPVQTNKNITAGLRAKLMDYDLSESLAQQYKEQNPYGIIDSNADRLTAKLKTMYPLESTDKSGNVTFHPENVEKIRQAIPDAVSNPTKYLGGKPTAQPAAQPAGQPAQISPAPPAGQREKGQVYSTPKGNLQWTGTGWLPAN